MGSLPFHYAQPCGPYHKRVSPYST
jgi:hypothetical protein